MKKLFTTLLTVIYFLFLVWLDMRNINDSGINILYNYKPLKPFWARLYMESIENKVKKNWNPKGYNEPLSAIVAFSLDSNGNVVKSEIFNSSDNSKYDEFCLKVIKDSAPYQKLPSKYKGLLQIQFTLDYKIKTF